MAEKLKWNTGGWFLGNIGGIWIFGKLSNLAGQAGDTTGAILMAAFVLMQLVTILYPWLNRATVPPGRAAVVHVVCVLAATFVAIWYFDYVAPAIDEQAKIELRRLPWIIGVILLLIFGLILYAKRAQAKEARVQASKPSGESTAVPLTSSSEPGKA